MEVKTEGIISMKTLKSREFNTDEFSCVRMVLYGLGSIRYVLLIMAKDKNYINHNWIGREHRGFFSILPHIKVAVLWCELQRNYYFLWGCKNQPIISF